jgi:integrating conjugative element protein (TIGR03757 family)
VKAALGSALLGAAGLLALAPASATAPQVEVFVAPHQVERITGQEALERAWPGAHIVIFDLGAPQQFEDRLSAGLPNDPVRAQRLLEQRLQATDLEAEALSAFAGLLRAARLGLDRLPAVVFDDAAIVYGVTDLSEAAEQYARWPDGQE